MEKIAEGKDGFENTAKFLPEGYNKKYKQTFRMISSNFSTYLFIHTEIFVPI